MISSQPISPPAQIQAHAPASAPKPNRPSWWIWIPFVWIFLASTRSLSTWFSFAALDGTQVDPDLSGSPWDRALLTLLIALALCVLGSRANRTKEVLRCNKWLIVLFAYMALSIIWSNFPAISLRRCFRSVGAGVVVLVALTERDPLEAVRLLLRRLYMIHIPLSVVAIKYVRSVGVAYTWDGAQEMWVGLTMHKNNLGQVAMCSGVVCTWQVLRNWSRKKLTLDLLLLVLTLWLLRGSESSHSSTAVLAFLIGVFVLFGLQLFKRRAASTKRILLGAAVLLAVLAPCVYVLSDALDATPAGVLLEATGRNATLSDRTLLWQDLFDNAAKSPLLGVGFGAFWVGHIGYDLYPFPNWSRVTHTWRPGEGHNGYIDVYVDLGIVGAALTFLVIASAFRGAVRDLHDRFEFGRLRFALLFSVLINNLAESSLLNGTHSLWFIFLLVAVNTPGRVQRDLPGSRRRALQATAAAAA